MGDGARGLQRRAATRGTTSRTIRRARARTAGARTGSPGSATSASGCAWRSRCGTAPTRSSRSGCSASPTARATTARTSRSTGSTWTSTPTHSYLKCQYKYPQRAFPYEDLVATNGAPRQAGDRSTSCSTPASSTRTATSTWSSSTPRPRHDDILMLVTAHNRGPDAATLHLLPTLWFRNTWSWGDDVAKPTLTAADGTAVAARAPPRARRVALARRRVGAAAVLRERDEQRAAVRRAQRVAVRQGRDQRLRRHGRRRGQPGADGHQGAPPTTCWRCRPGTAPRSACA